MRAFCVFKRPKEGEAGARANNERDTRALKDAKIFFRCVCKCKCASAKVVFASFVGFFFGRFLGSDRDLFFFDPFLGEGEVWCRVKQRKIIEPRGIGIKKKKTYVARHKTHAPHHAFYAYTHITHAFARSLRSFFSETS